MVLSIDIKQPTNHALILRAMLFSFTFEELNAALGQGKRNFYTLFV